MMSPFEARVKSGTRNVITLKYIEARILYPALCYPEIVTSNDSFSIFLISKEAGLEKNIERVAYFFRYTTWDNIHCRFLPQKQTQKGGGFDATEIKVESIQFPSKQEKYVYALKNFNLSKFVLHFYMSKGYKYLYELIVTPKSKLAQGMYHLFWKNKGGEKAKDDPISAEMKFLLDNFINERVKGIKLLHPALSDAIMSAPDTEYYLTEHESSNSGKQFNVDGKPYHGVPVEVLHPLIIYSQSKSQVTIAHLTDTHICMRADVLAKKAKEKSISSYNNFNERFKEALAKSAANNCEIAIITGDIIDFSRGHDGNSPLGEDSSYLLDKNWMLLYKLVKEGYDKNLPVAACLGNHDWRLNPYPPANSVYSIAAAMNVTTAQAKQLHGPGADKLLYYEGPLAETIRSNPLISDLEAVKWYFLLLNPFLDYIMRIPYGFAILMLDWMEEERISYGGDFIDLPVAEDSLTKCQKILVEHFSSYQEKCKIIGLHAQIVGPYTHMGDDLMKKGLYPCRKCNGDGCDFCMRDTVRIGDGPSKPAHSGKCKLYATSSVSKDLIYDKDYAVYGTIEKNRAWFIKQCGDHQVSLVLSGHAHRNTALRLENGGIMQGARAYLVTDSEIKKDKYGFNLYEGPIYINTASNGLVSYDYHTSGKGKSIKPGYTEITVKNTGEIPKAWTYKEHNLTLIWETPPQKFLHIRVRFIKVDIHDDEDTFGAGEIYFKASVADKKIGKTDIYKANSGETITFKKKHAWTIQYPVGSRQSPIPVTFEAWDEDVTYDDYLGKASLNLDSPLWGAGSHVLKSDKGNFTVYIEIDGVAGDYNIPDTNVQYA
jgi:predicted MPP superfamily phosphohydrolase